jgi:hypothetical protein
MTTTMTTTTTTKSVAKQLHINKLDIAPDLLTEIKSYCFYDTKSWETIQHIKSKKNRINLLINESCISRANPDNLYHFGADTDEHWSFWVFDEDDGDNPQFQAVNCYSCGEYKIISHNVPENIKCRCHFNTDNTINNAEYDSDDDSEYTDSESDASDGWISYDSADDDSYDE